MIKIQKDKQEVWPFILASLLLHVAIILLLFLFVRTPSYEEQTIEVVPIDLDKFGKIRIADIDKPKEEIKPKTPKFLGQYNSTTKDELVATGRVSKEPGKRGQNKKKEKIKPKPKKDMLYSMKQKKQQEKRKGKADYGYGTGATSSGDFFPDFKRGAHTYLNVLRYPGVDYFVRMKRAFRITFNPEPSLRSYFSFNRVSRGSVDVVIGVSVDNSGSLTELFVFRSSGISGYDSEALRTVRASAPFSSPPQKFLDDDGVLRMSWTFTVYL